MLYKEKIPLKEICVFKKCNKYEMVGTGLIYSIGLFNSSKVQNSSGSYLNDIDTSVIDYLEFAVSELGLDVLI